MKNISYSIVFALVATLAATRVGAAPIYEEHFDTNSTPANLATDYPNYNLAITGSAEVVNQQLLLHNTAAGAGIFSTISSFGPAVKFFELDFQLDGNPSDVGNMAAGLFIGTSPLDPPDNNVEVFAGYSVVQLRVEGTGGFGGTLIPFVPALGLMHRLEFTANGGGSFTFTLTTGTAANTFVPGADAYTTSWTNANLATSYQLGFLVLTGPHGATATFDNLLVYVPEPVTGTLLTSSLGLLMMRPRKRNRSIAAV